MRQILAVSGVLLLLAASVWWLRRKGLAVRLPGGGRKRSMESLERLVLSPQHSLHLVTLGGRALLLGTSPAGCTLLESFDQNSLAHVPGGPEVG